jgi:hypothetical protein
LESDVVLFEGSFEFVGAFIVEDVELWGIFVGLELLMETGPGGGQFAGLVGLEWFRKDDVAVIVVEDHDVIVTARRLYWELACLVGVRLS